MYINPFVCGIVFTILVEMGLTIAVAICISKKPKNDKEKE